MRTAVRGQHYRDFGSTIDGKFAASFKESNTQLLRDSASTGFRAPSLQQVFFASTFTDCISGEPLDVVLAANGSAVVNAAGIPKSKKEKSTSFTLGATFTPSKAFSLTADLCNIDIKDRIVLSGRFNADNFEAPAPTLRTLGVDEALFFMDSLKTRATGVDLTASHRAEFGAASLKTYLAFNYSKTEVKKINTSPAPVGNEDVLLSERERLFLE